MIDTTNTRYAASRHTRRAFAVAMTCLTLASAPALAQTAFGSSTTIAFPVVASTSSFTSEITLYNGNLIDVTVALDYFDANNLASPGAKPCSDVLLPANRSVVVTLSAQCTLDATSHFGLLTVSDVAATSAIFGYSRAQNPAGAGFSVEGFPIANFAVDTTSATGLKRTAAAPTYQTNCFVGSLADPVTYDLKLFDDTTGAQIGSTISDSLGSFAQIRYLDIFAAAAAPDGDYANVRAEFTRTSAGTQQMIGFCTVQDNVSLGADFRIAKSITPAPATGGVPSSATATWNGSIPTLLNGSPLDFAGPTTSITLLATATVTGYGGGWFAKASSGLGTLDVGVCYQDQSGPGPVTALGSLTNATGINGTQSWHFGNGSASLPAGSYNVGLCAQNLGSNSINKNGHTSGFVFVTP